MFVRDEVSNGDVEATVSAPRTSHRCRSEM